jgi:hypothetical protein
MTVLRLAMIAAFNEEKPIKIALLPLPGDENAH